MGMHVGQRSMRRVSAERVGRLLIVSHNEEPPTDQEWDELLEVFAREHLDRLRLVVFTEGGGPTPAQQGRLASALAGRPGTLQVAVISDRTAIRFIACTLALFIRRLRTFRRAELDAALTYLQLAPVERRAVSRFLGEEAPARRSYAS
ncbi:MAG: hypothetical protein ABW352_10715 [Polyangiales bacterium]